MDLTIAGEVYLCNKGGCGLKRAAPCINMCIIIRQLLFLRKMGQTRDLTDSEKSKIIKSLSKGCSTLEISTTWVKRRKLTAKDLRRIKREATRNSLSSSAVIFHNCNLPGEPRSTRCLVLRDMAKVRKAETRPPPNKTHKLKRQDWAKKYLKTDFSKVLWTDDMRVTLDRLDGRPHGWISNGHTAPLRVRC